MDCTLEANSGVWSLLDWNCQSKWDQICPPRGSACWAVCNESFWSLQIQNRIIFDRVVEVNVLQRLGILINGNDSIAVSNFSSLMDTLTFGTWFEVYWSLVCKIKSHLNNLLGLAILCHSIITTLMKILVNSLELTRYLRVAESNELFLLRFPCQFDES